jgi:hypothetical protein
LTYLLYILVRVEASNQIMNPGDIRRELCFNVIATEASPQY